jgi:hypothetical protein
MMTISRRNVLKYLAAIGTVHGGASSLIASGLSKMPSQQRVRVRPGDSKGSRKTKPKLYGNLSLTGSQRNRKISRWPIPLSWRHRLSITGIQMS